MVRIASLVGLRAIVVCCHGPSILCNLTQLRCGDVAFVVVVVVVVEAWRLELTQRSPSNSVWLLYLKGITALSTARNSNEAQKLSCYPLTGNVGFTALVRRSWPGR